jgi:hypothetical protein
MANPDGLTGPGDLLSTFPKESTTDVGAAKLERVSSLLRELLEDLKTPCLSTDRR